MNDTIKKEEVYKKIEGLHRILLGLNAFGSLDLIDFKLIEDYLIGSLGLKVEFEDDE